VCKGSIKKDTHSFIAMEKTTTIHMVTILGLMAVGLVLASIASSAGTVYAQANNSTSAAAKNMTSGATGGSNMTNATAGGNQSAANPLAKVPIIGKLLGGK
jgi:hypothetical protein